MIPDEAVKKGQDWTLAMIPALLAKTQNFEARQNYISSAQAAAMT